VETSLRSSSKLLIVGAIAAAIAGYMIGVRGSSGSGHSRAPVASTQQRPAFGASVLLESPSGWLTTPATQTIPGMTVAHTVVFAPHGDGAQAGLITGELQAGEPSPLPASFIAHLRGLPSTQVVNLSQGEAYRYSHMNLPGFDRLLTIYVIPRVEGGPSVLACYATAGDAHEIKTCEQIASTMRPVGQSSGELLAPEPEYARRVSAAIGALDRQRATVRSAVGDGAPLETVAGLASGLAHGFGHAAAAIRALQPPVVAGQAQVTLVGSLLRAAEAYHALAGAATAGDTGAYEADRVRVAAAEAAVGSALEGYSLLGYVQA
jgi:hypothetical protein